MNRLRFVLDTNVPVSALRSKRGGSFSLVVHHLDDPPIKMQVSYALMLEDQEILHRERSLLGLSEALRDFQFLNSRGVEAVTPKQFIAMIQKLPTP